MEGLEHVFNTRHGEYVLATRIAVGGMGEVFLALDPADAGMDRFVALKCLHSHLQDEPRIIEMFYREARLGSLFRHRNLVRVDDARMMNGRHTMVMEFAPGVTLRQVLDRLSERERFLPSHLVLQITEELLFALDYAHRLKRADGSSLGIIHRDLSPDNILIGFDGVVRLLDFGVAAAATTSHDSSLVGKVAYMSPEQVRGEAIDLRSDLFSVGTVYWEMLQGSAPFPRTDRIRALRDISEGSSSPPAATFGREHASDLDALWMRLHTKSRDERFPDARAAINALHVVQEKIGSVSNETLASFIQKLFPHEAAELQTICEKILRAPPPTENTLDMGNVDLYPDRREQDKSLTSIATVAAEASRVPPPMPVATGAPTAGSDNIQLSPTEFTTIQEIRRWRNQRNILIGTASVLLLVLAAVVFSLEPRTPEAPAPPVLHAVIRTTPAPSFVRINGELLPDKSPVTISGNLGDYYDLEIEHSGYVTALTSFILNEEVATSGLDVHLEPDRSSPFAPIGTLQVNYRPEDAVLSLNGVVESTTSPARIDAIPLNTLHTLRLEREGFQTLFVDVRLPTEDRLEFDLQMVEGVSLARLSVNSVPSGAAVSIDGQPVGVTPLQLLELPSQTTYSVSVRASGYKEWRRGVHLQSEDIVVSAQLEREPARTRGDSGTAGTGTTSAQERAPDLPYRMLE